MKCSVCQAILLPVAGEMFCLQCGQAEAKTTSINAEVLKPEETIDPVLKRALIDATDGEIVFADVTERAVTAEVVPADSQPQKRPGHTFLSLRALMAPVHPMATSGNLVMPQSALAVSTTPVSIDGGPVSPQADIIEPGIVLADRAIRTSVVRAWVIGLVGLGLFVGINLAISSYYSNRVYPGVHVGKLAVGGWTFDELHQKMPQVLPSPELAAVVGASRIELGLQGAVSVTSADLEREIRDSGRTRALPMAGAIGSLFARPISPTFALTDDAVNRSVQRLAAAVERAPSNAEVLIQGTDVFVLADKPGVQIDKVAAAAAVRAAYGHEATASISPVRLEPSVGAADYANDASLAQATITTNVQITVRKIHYSPTASQIASWIVMKGPGKGVAVNAAGAAAFITTIPGSFDRVGAVNALVAALNARQSVMLTPSTKRVTAGPKLASIAVTGPVANYTYCIDETPGLAPELVFNTATVLGPGGSWTLGGKIHFLQVKTGCNFVLRLASTSAMAELDPACEHQTSCRIHNDLAISKESWAKAPSKWVGDIKTYRSELINHVVGQWLGFDHPNCGAVAASGAVLATPSLQIAGCSPKWYAVPAELQDAKVLAGF